MGRARVYSSGGILVDYEGKRYALDPQHAIECDLAFISHAHVDHMHKPSKNERIIASAETRDLALSRGYELGQTIESIEGVELLDSGHILGSRAIRIDDELFYTGDAAGRERGFLGKCKTRRARILVIEATYGRQGFIFPPIAKIVKMTNTLISETFDKGRPVVLMGYSLGKAQLLCYLFSSWEPLYIHESIAKINQVHSKYGVELKEGRVFHQSNIEEELSKGPWLMIAPLMSGRSGLIRSLKKKYGAVSVAFSGWAIDPAYRLSLAIDYAFPLSDHCDHDELIRIVSDVSPELVYTTHGFAYDLARELRRYGFTARTLSPYQSSLTEYQYDD